MHADAVEFCSLQGPHALQLLASGTQDSQSVLRAWEAACAVADKDPPAALEAWLDFLHSYKCGQPHPSAPLACARVHFLHLLHSCAGQLGWRWTSC